MSELMESLADVIVDRAPTTTDSIKNLATGATFTAEIDYNPDPFSLDSDLMTDPRQKVRLFVTDYNQALSLAKGGFISIPFKGRQCKFKVVSGFPTPSKLQSEFTAIQQVSGLDN